jgi:hypothetical protein
MNIIIIQVRSKWCRDDFLDNTIVFTDEILIPTILINSIFVTLLSSRFIEPDFVKRGWLVNYITSLVKLFFSIEFTLAPKNALANSFDDRFIKTCAIHCFKKVIKINMELR